MIKQFNLALSALLLGMCTTFLTYAEIRKTETRKQEKVRPICQKNIPFTSERSEKYELEKKEKVRIICQKNIPFTIKRSGKYELGENVTFNGSGNAITIKADNVQLNLNSFSISLSKSTATGIFVDNASEFVIESDNIINTSSNSQTGFGINVVGAQKGLIKNIFTENALNGLRIKNSTDIQVQNSEFFKATAAGALVMNSTNIAFDTCVFNACNNGILFSGANRDCSIVNSNFPSSLLSNLLAQKISGLIIENCAFTELGGNPAKLNLVQFGDEGADQTCNDVLMKNCTLVNKSTNTAPEGLAIFHGSGFLVDSCVIDIDNTGQDLEADLSGIHITQASNVIIRNCITQGPATNGFYPDEGASNVVIEDCVATGAQKNGIFLALTTASKVQNNLVTNNGTNGIFLGETSVSNAVLNNTVSKNGFAPILTSTPPIQCGIGIAADSSKNTVQYNQVFSNAQVGISDLGTGNTVYFNSAFDNPTNYSANITNVSSPGGPAKSAENISQ